jgi:hypothetical protein
MKNLKEVREMRNKRIYVEPKQGQAQRIDVPFGEVLDYIECAEKIIVDELAHPFIAISLKENGKIEVLTNDPTLDTKEKIRDYIVKNLKNLEVHSYTYDIIVA